MVWAIYAQTLRFDFTNYDDGDYVYENPFVTNGLRWRSVLWAFTHVHAANWHPLTWIAHMVDAQLYGSHAGGHHASNVLLHTANSILLFLVLLKMTRSGWSSAFVAAIFAVHPLRAESVAWVAERKDVLSGLFFMLTLSAYTFYAQERIFCAAAGESPDAGGAVWMRRSAVRWYVMTAVFFSLGLLSKPSLVTLPFVLLLLDYWPLRRFGRVRWWLLCLEKLPLAGLVVASIVATLLAQTQAMMSVSNLPIRARIANATWGYVAYLGEMIYPVNLAVLYPLGTVHWQVLLPSAALLIAITVTAILFRKGQPWLFVGWCWYLGVLVPMIGLVQVGSQAHADRYTYLSQIGLYIALTWSARAWVTGHDLRKRMIAAAAATVVIVLVPLAYRQVSFWRNSETLWRHTLACTDRNPYALNLLAVALSEQGRSDEAFDLFQKSLHINPRDAGTQFYIGLYQAKHGQLDLAIKHFRLSLYVVSQNPGAETNLGMALESKGQPLEAIKHYRKAIELDPQFADALNNLAWLLATGPAEIRDGAEAVRLAERANHIEAERDPETLDTLAAAYAESGRFGDAVSVAKVAINLADPALAASLRNEMTSYAANKPLRIPAPPMATTAQ